MLDLHFQSIYNILLENNILISVLRLCVEGMSRTAINATQSKLFSPVTSAGRGKFAPKSSKTFNLVKHFRGLLLLFFVFFSKNGFLNFFFKTNICQVTVCVTLLNVPASVSHNKVVKMKLLTRSFLKCS